MMTGSPRIGSSRKLACECLLPLTMQSLAISIALAARIILCLKPKSRNAEFFAAEDREWRSSALPHGAIEEQGHSFPLINVVFSFPDGGWRMGNSMEVCRDRG